MKKLLFAIGCLAIAVQVAFYLRFPVEHPGRHPVTNNDVIHRSGWTDQGLDAHLNADEKTPLYGKPNQNGLRDGLAMYLPAGDWDLYVHLEYEGEVLFMFDFGRARQLNAGAAEIVGKAKWSSLDWQFTKIKCSARINEWCEVLVSAKSTVLPAVVSAKSRMFAFGSRDEDREAPPGWRAIGAQ
jgi:hypothetical protein